MTTTTTTASTLPPGVYGIGDPCNLLTDAEWREVEPLRDFQQLQQSFTLASGCRVVEIDTHGDGWLLDQDDFCYAIDSGRLAIRFAADVPAEGLARLDHGTWDSDAPPMGAVHTFGRHFDVFGGPSRVFQQREIQVGHLTLRPKRSH